jgi:hypothetical protein
MTKFPIKILLENCLDATGDQSSLHQIDIFSNGHFRNGDHSRLQKRFGDYTADRDGAGTQFTLATNFFFVHWHRCFWNEGLFAAVNFPE